MTKPLLKINYSRKKWLGITSPFYHSSFEIHHKNKITKIGYYAMSDFLWPISLILPVLGEIRTEIKDKPKYSKTLCRNSNKVAKILRLVKSKKYNWKVYHAVFRNCFHWRNSILKEAGIKCPIRDWFFKNK